MNSHIPGVFIFLCVIIGFLAYTTWHYRDLYNRETSDYWKLRATHNRVSTELVGLQVLLERYNGTSTRDPQNSVSKVELQAPPKEAVRSKSILDHLMDENV